MEPGGLSGSFVIIDGGAGKRLAMTNLAGFTAYVSLMMVHAALLAKCGEYRAFNDLIWFEYCSAINLYSVIALIMNIPVFIFFAYRLHRVRPVSFCIAVVLAVAVSQAWFWSSVLPCFFIYLLSGGIAG